ncbi:MAG: heavy metal translocating P-type ATPase [Armatimonadaceae bacterium]
MAEIINNSNQFVLTLRGSVAGSCADCAERLRTALLSVTGVKQAQIVPANGSLQVEFDPAYISVSVLTDVARQTQSELEQRFAHRIYRVEGMDCAHCADGLEQMACSLPGVVGASVHFSSATLRVEYDPARPEGIGQIERRARNMGFGLTERGNIRASAPAAPEPTGTDLWRQRLVSPMARAVASLIFLAVGLFLEHATALPEVAAQVAYGLSLLIGGYRFALAGLAALRSRIVGTNLLMALAAVGAVIIGHWEEAAMVVSLYAIGIGLEGAAMDRTRQSLKALVDSQPAEAIVRVADGSETVVPVEHLLPGDLMVVRPGGKIAADGEVVQGTSAVSEAAITGESVPADKTEGSTVFAGSLNGNGALLVRVTASGEDSTLARLLHLVEEAQGQKAPTQTLIERFGRIYTPIVLVTALVIGFGGPLLNREIDWTYRALTLLVVSCPCALIIATPVAYVSAIARAARNGVLVKGGAYLEALADSRTVYFDKTGTLTSGSVQVSDIVTAEEGEEAENRLLALAAAVERESEHPIAQAVVLEAARRAIPLREAASVQALPGRGIEATVANTQVGIGNHRMASEQEWVVSPALAEREKVLAESGKTTLLIAIDGTVQGVIAVADTLRPEAAEVAARVQRTGRRTEILTGDNAAVARTIGASVGITEVKAGLLPQDKLAAVQVRSAQESVVFVGDGINDAPALAAATVGVAMGAGTAAALEAADIALVQSDLRRIPWTIRLAEATRNIVRTNVVVSVAAVVVLLGATVLGKLSLPLGVLGHEGSALLVILNGIRLLSPSFLRLDEK